jgi:cytochrome c-type biogenesis protein CcmH
VLTFWLLAATMTLIGLAFIVIPMLRSRPAKSVDAASANLAVLRAQRREIDAEVLAGTLAPAERESALAELVERADADLAATEPLPAATGAKPWAVVIPVALLVPAMVFGTYLAVGTPRAADPAIVAASHAPASAKEIEAMVDTLAEKVKSRPDDVQGWTLLARSTAALGRFQQSAAAYEHLSKLTPRDADVLADYADALGMAQGKKLAGKPHELVKEALSIDPAHRKALALAATAEMEIGDYASSLGHWEALARQLPPGSEDEAQVRGVIAEVTTRAVAAGQGLKAAKPALATAAPAAPAASAGRADSVSGSVSIAPLLAGKVGASDTLFVYARAEGGPRMPLAVLRTGAAKLPLAFKLDDSMAMTPQMKISGAASVRIEARVSRTGNATPQPGDLTGTSDAVKPGARDVKIVIGQVVP